MRGVTWFLGLALIICATSAVAQPYSITLNIQSDPPGLTVPDVVMDNNDYELNAGEANSFWVRSSNAHPNDLPYTAFQSTSVQYNLDSPGPNYADGGDPNCTPHVVATGAQLHKGNGSWPVDGAPAHCDWYQLHDPTDNMVVDITYKPIEIPITIAGDGGLTGASVVYHEVTGHSVTLTESADVTAVQTSSGSVADNGDDTWTLSGVTDLSGVTLTTTATGAEGEGEGEGELEGIIWTFDADTEDWSGNAMAPTSWADGAMIQTIADGSPFDPIVAHGTAYNADDNPNLSMKVTCSGMPDGATTGAYFTFPAAGGHTRSGYTVSNGEQTVRFNVLAAQEGSNGDHVGEINNGRLDIPDNTGIGGYENAEIRFDWIALSPDANIDPEPPVVEEADPVVFRFDCDTDGWAAVNNVNLGHTLGWMVYTPTGADPHAWVAASIEGTSLPEFGAVIEVQNAPDANPFTCAMYWFADGGHGRVPFNVQEGANVVRFNVPAGQDAGTGAWDDSVNHIRLDLPEQDQTPFVAAGTTFLVDAIAISDDPEFIPDPWTIDNDCDNDGLSNDYEATLGTDPTNADTDGDGVADGIEVQYGTDPLDPQDFVTVPVMNWLGLGLTALLLAAAALVLVTRRRGLSH